MTWNYLVSTHCPLRVPAIDADDLEVVIPVAPAPAPAPALAPALLVVTRPLDLTVLADGRDCKLLLDKDAESDEQYMLCVS